MAVPDYETIMLPVLRLAGDKKEHSLREAIDRLANEFKLTEMERKVLLPSGRQEVLDNRVGWARTYLKKAGLVEITRPGYFCITERGIELLNKSPSKIDVGLLYAYPEFREFKSLKKVKADRIKGKVEGETETPVEELESAYQNLNINIESELLQNVKSVLPNRFETIVIDLLVKMGYGGSYKDAAEAIGGTGDEGLDGVINEDRLGLDRVYIQAKRWGNRVVGRPVVQGFVGALEGKHANKGILITTSEFTGEALDYISSISSRVILIDGERLTQLMLEYNIGCSPVARYEVKKIDTDYFVEA